MADAECGESLRCSGLTIFREGFCRAENQFGAFTADDAEFQGSGVVDWQVADLDGAAEDIVVQLDVDVPDRWLRIELIDPAGQRAMLWDGAEDSGPRPERLVADWGIDRNGKVSGRWRLRVRSLAAEPAFVVRGATLRLSSRRWEDEGAAAGASK